MILEELDNRKIFYRIDELKAKGYSLYQINQLVNCGKLEKINKSTYENKDFDGDGSDYYYAYAYIPNGVICTMSAAAFYSLTTFRPDAIDVAIPRKAKVSTLPKWPSINLHYFTDDRFETGILTINNCGNTFKIYDLEKTVCDIVFYRNHIGIEETKEVLIKYLNNKDRNLNSLVRYASQLKCDEILKTYLEMLL